MSAENVNGSVRVTWNTTAPPECVASVTVEFKTTKTGSAIVTYTTTNTSQTEVIQTGLQCGTYYYIAVKVRVAVTGDGVPITLNSIPVQVPVSGGKVSYCQCT